MWTTSDWWKRCMETVWSQGLGDKRSHAAVTGLLRLIDWLASLSGSPGLFLLKCWNSWFFIVVWKGSLPAMQETERLPCSKNARFPGSIPWAPSPDRSQNISSFRIQGHCIFILIQFFFLPSTVPGSEAGSCSSSSGPDWVCCPDSDLMFRLAVASSALECVTDAEDTQLATGRGGVWRCEADLQCVSACVFSSINPVLSQLNSHVFVPLCEPASGHVFCLSASSERSVKGPVTPVLIRPWHVWTVCFRNTSASALRLLSVRIDPHIYLQNSPPSLCLPFPLLCPSSANRQYL